MLYLVTGQPGNGKTLFTLNTVETRRQSEGRGVYQDGISGLTLPWVALPLKSGPFKSAQIEKGFPEQVPDWDSVPDGSIIVIDEAWKFFPPRGNAGIAPEYVQFLAEHRHRGFDVYIVTQGRGQLDAFVKTLVGRHYHLDRKFGVDIPTLWQWERCADPSSDKDKREGQSSLWKYPKESFGWYSSAVMHTHKRNLPWKKVAVLVLGIGMVAMGGSCAYRSIEKNKRVKGEPVSGVVAGGSIVRGGVAPGAAYWGEDRKERVYGVPASAPIFDSLQKVQTQPRIEGCMQLVRGESIQCRCTGPGGAVLDVLTDRCVTFVKRGWFDETRKYDDVKLANVQFLNDQSARNMASSLGQTGQDAAVSSGGGAPRP